MPVYFGNKSHDIMIGKDPIEKMGGNKLTYSMYGDNIPIIDKKWSQTYDWQADGVTWSFNSVIHAKCSNDMFTNMWKNGCDGVRTLSSYPSLLEYLYPCWNTLSKYDFSNKISLTVELPVEIDVSSVEVGFWRKSYEDYVNVNMILYDVNGNVTGYTTLANGINSITDNVKVKSIEFCASSISIKSSLSAYVYSLIINAAY